MVVKTRDELRTVYREPQGIPLDKVINELDDHCREFLAKSPFMVLSTADANGVVDGSPKGGEPGFARVMDDGRVVWPDLSGNNRLDSFENLVVNPSVALLFMIPGLNESLRINGTAELLTDQALCEQFSTDGRAAKVVVAVSPTEAYIHCAKAYRRAQLWDPDSWLPAKDVPNAVEMVRDHASVPLSEEAMADAYEDAMQSTMWTQAGDE